MKPRSHRALVALDPSCLLPWFVALWLVLLAASEAMAHALPPDGPAALDPGTGLPAPRPGTLIVELAPGAAPGWLAAAGAGAVAPAFDLTANRAAKVERGLDRFFLLTVDPGADLAGLAASLAADPAVVSIEPDGVAHAALAPNDPLYPAQWAHDNRGQAVRYGGGTVGTPDCDTDTPEAWDVEEGAAGITIAIIDTGLDLGHPEFAGRIVAGYDFVNNDTDPSDDQGHGTSCAGIAAAAAGNGAGVAGVAWAANLMPVKVLDRQGSGYWSWVANGIVWAADHGAGVLSLSLGGSTGAAMLEAAVNYAWNAGCLVLAAAGNSNRGRLDYPGAYPNAIAVGALSPCNERKSPSSCDGETWWGSNYGNGIEFLAPGTRIHSTDIRGASGFAPGDYLSTFNGTSAATPQGAGIAALVRRRNPGRPNRELRDLLRLTCDDLGPAGYDRDTGYGRVNARRAVDPTAPPDEPTTVTLFEETFEVETVPGARWLAADSNPAHGEDFWGDQSRAEGARVHAGSWSAYSADHSDARGQSYDHNMAAAMTAAAGVSVAGHTDVRFGFWLWCRTANARDYLAFEYWDGTAWVEAERFSGNATRGRWVNALYELSGFDTFQWRFVFVSDARRASEGAYVDDVVLTGVTAGAGAAPRSEAAVVPRVRSVGLAGAPEAMAAAAPAAPARFALAPNHPNPFNPATTISYELAAAARAALAIYDVDGRRVRLLVDAVEEAGPHAATWDGRDDAGRALASGVYFCRLESTGQAAVRKLTLIR